MSPKDRKRHDEFFPRRAQIEPGLQPADTEFHDVLLIPPPRKDGTPVVEPEEFYRFPVIKSEQLAPGELRGGERLKTGTYSNQPELWDRDDTGQRKVLGIAHPQRVYSEGGSKDNRGPAFAVMPVRPEPGASSCAFCYLVNAQNVLSPNAWTAEEWNAPGGPDLVAEAHANQTEAELLLALPRGLVVSIRATGLDNLDEFPDKVEPARVTKHGVTYEIEPVRLNNETEIWSELRNGCIAGRVLHRQRERVIPLLNVTSLMSPLAAAEGGKP